MFVGVDVVGGPNEHETRVRTAPARWKLFSIDARNLVVLRVFRVVDDLVDARVWHLISGFEDISDTSHLNL